MVTNPVSGAFYFLRGFSLIHRSGIRRYVIIPMTINIMLFSAVIAFGINYFDAFVEQLKPEIPEWLAWFEWLFWILFLLVASLITFFCFSLVANIIAAPFNSLLAEAVEEYLTGQPPAQGGGWRKALAEFVPGIMAEAKKFLYFIGFAIPCLVLFLIPMVNVAAPFVWMLFSIWVLALEYLDYPMANSGHLFPANRNVMSRRRLQSLGFGGAVMVATLIPIGNFIVMPVAVAGATAMWVEKYRDQEGVRS